MASAKTGDNTQRPSQNTNTRNEQELRDGKTIEGNDAARLDERVARQERGEERAPAQKLNFTKVKIKNRGDAVETRRIDDIIVATDGNGQVTYVEFGGADIETE